MGRPIPKLTDEEKARFEPMLQRTWSAIAGDAEMASGRFKPLKVREIIEITCDANHPEMYGKMTREEYARLSECYHHNDTQRWLRKVLNY